MIDQELARLRTHRRNIQRYRNLVADVSIFVVVSQIARAFRRRVAGFPRADRDLEFWLQAESEINEEKRQ
jgi:hypothetical protein